MANTSGAQPARNTPSSLTFTNPQTAAMLVVDMLAEIEEDSRIDAWLVETILGELRRTDPEGQVAALVQALADRLEDARTMNLAQDTARKLLDLLKPREGVGNG